MQGNAGGHPSSRSDIKMSGPRRTSPTETPSPQRQMTPVLSDMDDADSNVQRHPRFHRFHPNASVNRTHVDRDRSESRETEPMSPAMPLDVLSSKRKRTPSGRIVARNSAGFFPPPVFSKPYESRDGQTKYQFRPNQGEDLSCSSDDEEDHGKNQTSETKNNSEKAVGALPPPGSDEDEDMCATKESSATLRRRSSPVRSPSREGLSDSKHRRKRIKSGQGTNDGGDENEGNGLVLANLLKFQKKKQDREKAEALEKKALEEKHKANDPKKTLDQKQNGGIVDMDVDQGNDRKEVVHDPTQMLGGVRQVNPYFNSTDYDWKQESKEFLEAKERWKAKRQHEDEQKDLRLNGRKDESDVVPDEERNWHLALLDGDSSDVSRSADADLVGPNPSARQQQFRQLLRTNYINLDADEMEVYLKRWYRCLNDFVGDHGEQLNAALDLWKWCRTENIARNSLEEATTIVKDLTSKLKAAQRLDPAGDVAKKRMHEFSSRTLSALIRLYVLRQMGNNSLNILEINSTLQGCSNLDVHDHSLEMPERKDEELNETLRLQEKTLQLIQAAKIVRVKGKAYEPVKNDKGIMTRAYQRYQTDFDKEGGEIRDFLEECAYPENVPSKREYYLMLNRGLGNVNALAMRLETIRSYRYPQAQRERDWQHYNNGLWDVRTARWYPLGSKAYQNLPHDRIPCAMHRCSFDYYEYLWYSRNGGALDFMKVPSPADMIIDCQKWQWEHEPEGSNKPQHTIPSKEPVWVYAEGGALLFSKRTANHPLKKYVPTYLGPGGYGKTTLLKIFALFYDQFDVAQFKTKEEEVFGMERLPESYIWMGYDIGRDWRIDYQLLFTLIDGGYIKISQKCKKNFLYYVEQYGMLAMNEYLNLPDTGGAWSRRNLLHCFRYPPAKGGDNELLEKAERETGATMYKATMAIRYITRELKGKKAAVCRETMPTQMWKNLQEMRRATNPLRRFFESKCVITHQNPDYYVAMQDFNAVFQRWCKDTGVGKRAKLDSATSLDVLMNFKCSIVEGVRIDPKSDISSPDRRHAGWVVGCTLADMQSNCDALWQSDQIPRTKAGEEWMSNRSKNTSGKSAASPSSDNSTTGKTSFMTGADKPVSTTAVSTTGSFTIDKTTNKTTVVETKTTTSLSDKTVVPMDIDTGGSNHRKETKEDGERSTPSSTKRPADQTVLEGQTAASAPMGNPLAFRRFPPVHTPNAITAMFQNFSLRRPNTRSNDTTLPAMVAEH